MGGVSSGNHGFTCFGTKVHITFGKKEIKMERNFGK